MRSAFDYGVRKVMAKMGISTMQSYHGAQIFEALGIHKEVRRFDHPLFLITFSYLAQSMGAGTAEGS